MYYKYTYEGSAEELQSKIDHIERSGEGSKLFEKLVTSLRKKDTNFSNLAERHFNEGKARQGQPYNNTAKGRTEKKHYNKRMLSLESHDKKLMKTERALWKLLAKLEGVDVAKVSPPKEIVSLVDCGRLIQCEGYCNRFFLEGVEEAIIIWNYAKNRIESENIDSVKNKEELKTFNYHFTRLVQHFNV